MLRGWPNNHTWILRTLVHPPHIQVPGPTAREQVGPTRCSVDIRGDPAMEAVPTEAEMLRAVEAAIGVKFRRHGGHH